MVQASLFNEVEEDLRERMRELLRSDSLIFSEKAVILCLLSESAFGQNRAISIDRIQCLSLKAGDGEYGDRTIKQAVKSLLEKYGLPVGSCRIPGQNGYYICISDSDAEDAVRPLKAEIFSLFRRIKGLSPNSAFVRQLNGQMELMKED